MAIKTDAAALEAKYGGKSGGAQPPPTAEFYYPGSGKPPPGTSGPHQIPQGKPVEPGQFISQVVGRGEAVMAPPQIAVVPPQQHVANQPQMAVMPPQPTMRTSIGTIVEPQPHHIQPQTVIPSGTNPMAAAEPEPPKQEQVEQAPKAERPKLDLAKMICDHVWEMGGEKSEAAQKFYERSGATLKNWMTNPGNIPLAAILKFMHRTPGIKDMILEELEPHFEANGREGWVTSVPNRTKTNVMICSAVLDRPTLPFTTVLAYLTKKYELGFTFQADTMIHRSRNMLAKRFLESGCLWSLWLDADMAPPIANPDWFRFITNCTSVPQEYCGYDVLGRMLGQSKAVLGGVYASRKWHGALVMQPEINPRSHEDKLLCNEIRRGTARGLAEVDWIGFGCALVHREVFLEVQRSFPMLAPQTEMAPWRYFQPEGDEGEDEAFCRRVKACGIPIWLDTQLICGHIGSMAFLPEHTNPVLAL